MPVSFHIRRQGLPVPHDELPIKLGQIFIPPHLHKFLRIIEGEGVRASPAEIVELIARFHPAADLNIHYTNLQTLMRIFEIMVLPWILSIQSMDYETNIMKFSTD
ncbi:hypothetical protein DFH28DRAFT_885959 [Melampsora americana]|nr:hypothetical protein DFH28DRAFT_885959 [Melampsora americana]